MSSESIGPELTVFILVGVSAFVLAAIRVLSRVWALVRDRNTIRSSLAQDGFQVRQLRRRWLTRGPFPDMRLPGSKNSGNEYLYRVVADDRGGRPMTGWIRGKLRWPWQPAESWSLRWDEQPGTKTKGLSTAQFYALLLLGMVIIFWLVGMAWRDQLTG